MLAGLVSFPIFTRLLDNTQYGMLGYYGTWVAMAIAAGKLGAQHTILRFYPHGADDARLRAFATNLVYLPLAMSFALWAVAVVALVLIDLATGLRQSAMFWVVVVSAPPLVFASQVDTVLRVTERSRLVMYSRATWRWMELVLMLGAVLLIQRSAVIAYTGKLVAALVMVVFYWQWLRRHFFFSRDLLDTREVREGLAYGMPLVANEVVAVALASLDRVMLLWLLHDFAAVGIYTIGISLATQLAVFMNATVFEAFAPVANRLYTTDGPAAVRALKARILMPMTYVAVGAATLLGCFGSDLIVAASGPAKAASGPVFAVTGVVCALQPLLMLGGYGLVLQKKSVRVLWLMCGSLLLNLALNLLWIPAYGVMGAVYATAISSMALGVAHCLWVPRELRQLPDRRTAVTAIAVGLGCVALAFAVGNGLQLAPGWHRLLVDGAATAAAYGLGVLALDPRMRGLLNEWRSGVRLDLLATRS